MASTSKCPYCNGIVTSNEKICPHCGASNLNYVDDSPKVVMVPKTIEDLKEFCAERGMPLYRMRFFIGEDFKEPCAFGIFKKEDGTVVVYKNKDTGVRAIRYEGLDEAHGVEELYLKLLDECHKRGIFPETVDGKPPADFIEQQWEDAKEGATWLGIIGLPLMSIAISTLSRNAIPLFFSLLIAMIPLSVTFLCLRRVWRKRKTAPIAQKDVTNNTMTKKGYTIFTIIFAITLLIGTINTVKLIANPVGYYNTPYGRYYRLNDNWYSYDSTTRDWYYDSDYDGSGAVYSGGFWSSNWGDSSDKFTNSDTYSDYWEAHHSSSSDGSYDSWDSGGTDWSSDW